MKKLIQMWLFGTDDIDSYMDLLRENMNYTNKHIDALNDHIKTLDIAKEDLDIIRKLIRICENHGINVDEEIKEIKLYEGE